MVLEVGGEGSRQTDRQIDNYTWKDKYMVSNVNEMISYIPIVNHDG